MEKIYKKHTTKRTKEFIDTLVKEYNNGSTLTELSLKYKTDACYQFRVNNIPKRTTKESALFRNKKNLNKYNWDFSEISNEYEAYIFGILYADGYVSNNQIGLRLKEKDKDILLEIKNYISNDIKLQNDKKSYAIVVSGMLFTQNIIKLGFIGKKEDRLKVFPKIPEHLMNHFIRGYFDGDGTIFRISSNSKLLRGNICSTEKSFLEEIQKILQKEGFVGSITLEKRKGKLLKIPGGTCIGNKDMYRLYFNNIKDLDIFKNYIYKDATIFLKRKRDVFYNTSHGNTELI